MKHPYDFTKAQVQALWLSAEHWLKNWQDPENASAKAKDCECCNQFYDSFVSEHNCHECPIYQFTGFNHCATTPYTSAEEAIEEIQLYGFNEERHEAIEAEYEFLVCLALGEDINYGYRQED